MRTIGSVEILLEDETDTERLGRALADVLPHRALIFLSGPLGAGKTTLIRALLRSIGHNGPVKSPTYSLV
ncbi:tRNA (adenosine(37)-N6)-threonylcarbamoyltransferase complex ATPase subunit type 1 TsaE, partial [Acidihalobacter prosperus]